MHAPVCIPHASVHAHTQASVHIPHTSVHTHAHTLGTLAFHYKLIRENPHLQLSYDKKLDVHALKMSNSRMIPRIFILCVRLFACVPHVPLPVITVLKPNEDKEGLQEVALQNGHGVGSDLRPNWAIRNKG